MVASEGLQVEILEKERNQPIHQWVYQVLRVNIIKLTLRPAQKISENEVSEALGISRTPVREAFIRLAEDGLIKITPQKRSIVSLIDLEQAQEARFVRLAVEKALMKEACGGLSVADLAALDGNLREQEQCRQAKAFDRMLSVDNDFHRLIFRGCRKERSWLYLKKLDYNYDRLRVMVMPVSIDRIVSEHGVIRDLIRDGKVDSVDEIVDRHLTWEMINRVVRDYPQHYFTQDRRNL
ncbi:MAG TPA: GntR family transcriptional regulator [Spirochaetia bacterium]|nr:GntR family transcriptional regulator [Spirochaetia bacterium]